MPIQSIGEKKARLLAYKPAKSFQQFPSCDQWKKESSVGSRWSTPFRKHDRVLVAIDEMVKRINKGVEGGERLYELCGLFFCTLYWNNHYKQHSKMDSGRRGAIMSLNMTVANELVAPLNCSLNNLALTLQQIFGKTMNEHGLDLDTVNDPKYFDVFAEDKKFREQEIRQREKCRAIFKNSKLYALQGQPLGLNALTTLQNRLHGLRYGFVMTMSNELFVGLFGDTHAKYHSSFMSGKPVQCAGTIRVIDGRITEIENDSGHYTPRDASLAKVLRHLKNVGINIAGIKVCGHAESMRLDIQEQTEQGIIGGKYGRKYKGLSEDKKIYVKGDVFLRNNGNWDQIVLSMGHLKEGVKARLQF